MGFFLNLSTATSGVPQGSHLGPLFFIIYLNNINQCFKTARFLLYADDLKIYSEIKSQEDCHDLQEDLNGFVNYCQRSSLFLNLEKCNIITFTRNKTVFPYDYKIKNCVLKRVEQFKDLGVVMDSKMSFNFHIEYVINSCNRLLGFVLRNCKNFNNSKTLLTLYYAFIHSRLSFASVVWNPCYVTYERRLERIQNKFLKHLAYKSNIIISHGNFTPIYKQFCVLPLFHRRRVTDLITFFKCITGLLNCEQIIEKITLSQRNIYINFRHDNNYTTPFRKTNSPVCRMIRTFNVYCENENILDMSIFTVKKYFKDLFLRLS